MRAFRQLPGTIRGAVWMILGGTSLVLLAVTIRELEGRYGVLQMIFMRSVISLILILPWVLKQKREEIKTCTLPG